MKGTAIALAPAHLPTQFVTSGLIPSTGVLRRQSSCRMVISAAMCGALGFLLWAHDSLIRERAPAGDERH